MSVTFQEGGFEQKTLKRKDQSLLIQLLTPIAQKKESETGLIRARLEDMFLPHGQEKRGEVMLPDGKSEVKIFPAKEQ